MPDWVLWVVIAVILIAFGMGFWLEFGVAGFTERRSRCPACSAQGLEPVEPTNGRVRCGVCAAEFREEPDGRLTQVNAT